MSDNYVHNKESYFSPCCKAFNIFNNNIISCSCCGKKITQLSNEEELTISIVYNVIDNTTGAGKSMDIINESIKKAPRHATDQTLEKSSVKCDKCKSFMRINRDTNETMYFICSNPKCRHIKR